MEERTGTASLKVPGGKLIRVKIAYDSCIRKAEITGDFFIHPEGGISAIESSLEGLPVDSGEVSIAAAVQSVIDENNIQAIGIDAKSVAKAVRMAMQ